MLFPLPPQPGAGREQLPVKQPPGDGACTRVHGLRSEGEALLCRGEFWGAGVG